MFNLVNSKCDVSASTIGTVSPRSLIGTGDCGSQPNMDISFSTNSGSFCGNATIQSPGSYDSLKSSSKNSICRVSLFESYHLN